MPGAIGPVHRGGVVNIDNEESLLVVRASAGSADASVGGPHLSASFAIGRFEVEDLLVGPRSRSHRYLARSFDAQITGGLPDWACDKRFVRLLSSSLRAADTNHLCLRAGRRHYCTIPGGGGGWGW